MTSYAETTPSSADTGGTRLATRLSFFAAGFVMACWAPMVPFAKANVGADEGQLVGRRITIGSVVLDVVKRIDRCVMITRAQPGGIERDAVVLRTVLREHDGFLGVGALVVTPGQLALGDAVVELGAAADGGGP